MSWFARWFGSVGRAAESNDAALASLDEVLASMRKSARAQVRLAARLEELDAKLDARFADLRAAGRPPQAPPAPLRAMPVAGELPAGVEEILDALDALDEAKRALERTEVTGVADGLRVVATKLTRALGRASIERIGEVGTPVDGRLLRVVGTEARDDLPEGAVTRVVRAAAVTNGRLVREGEVFANKRPARDSWRTETP